MDRKNCVISNASVLVEQFLTQLAHMRYIKIILALAVDHCLKPPSWQEWIVFLNKAWNWSLLPITFSISLPSIFKRMMGLNVLGVLYNALLGLGMMMNIDSLKWDGQYLKLIHTLAIFMMLTRHAKFLVITLRCLQDNLSGLEVESLLHLLIDIKNSSFKKDGHLVAILSEISSSNKVLTCWCWAELNDLWRACHRLSISRHGCLLYLITSMAGSFHFLTQFMSFHGPFLLFEISCILALKNSLLVLLTAFLKLFQSFNYLEAL